MNIFKSASKMVFMLMALATCIALFLKFISGEQFLILASMAFSFYFSNKPTDNSGTITK
jgi:hypothetical protein